ncbi:hypothetical protein [Streptomyces specialis]|uniref:hypothetical protein n=1 Tax=Streptomyces specialis TaxID=498367 RepID=UPI000ADCDF88|nr:hypothetical protein [Streptomyces specialis]
MTDELSVAHRLAGLFKGSYEEAGGELVVLTGWDRVRIRVDSAGQVVCRMTTAPLSGSSEEAIAGASGHPGDVVGPDRKAVARSGRGPGPVTSVGFRLAGDPGLGLFLLRSGGWALADAVPALREAVAAARGPACGSLWLRPGEFTTPEGYPGLALIHT